MTDEILKKIVQVEKNLKKVILLSLLFYALVTYLAFEIDLYIIEFNNSNPTNLDFYSKLQIKQTEQIEDIKIKSKNLDTHKNIINNSTFIVVLLLSTYTFYKLLYGQF